LIHDKRSDFSVDNFELQLREMERRYPEVFRFMRGFGWTEEWVADPERLEARHQIWSVEMHPLARRVLSNFSGLRCSPGVSWPGVDWGRHPCVAGSLVVVQPYDVETHFLKEEPPWLRPPAFPIGTMNDWMMFMREDWTTITVGCNFRIAMISADPFEVIKAQMIQDDAWFSRPEHMIEFDDEYVDQLPHHLMHLKYMT
jgi:hypothetical protein